MLQQAVAQVSTAPSAGFVSFGAWLAIIAGAAAVVVAIFRLGRVVERVDRFETTVVKKLDEFIAASNSRLPEWSGWRERADSRLGRVEEDVSAIDTRVSALEGERRSGRDRRDGE